jgi:hypothetical protein
VGLTLEANLASECLALSLASAQGFILHCESQVALKAKPAGGEPVGLDRRAERGKSRSLRRSDGLNDLPPSTVGRFDIHEATGNPRLFFSNAETRAGFIEPLLVFIPVDCCAPPHGAAFHRFIDAGDFHVRTAN